jgi:hypothetical protein
MVWSLLSFWSLVFFFHYGYHSSLLVNICHYWSFWSYWSYWSLSLILSLWSFRSFHLGLVWLDQVIYLLTGWHNVTLWNHIPCMHNLHIHMCKRWNTIKGTLLWADEPQLEFNPSHSSIIYSGWKFKFYSKPQIIKCGFFLQQGGWTQPSSWYHICNSSCLSALKFYWKILIFPSFKQKRGQIDWLQTKHLCHLHLPLNINLS